MWRGWLLDGKANLYYFRRATSKQELNDSPVAQEPHVKVNRTNSPLYLSLFLSLFPLSRRATKLEYVMYRMGLLATLRSRAKNGQTIGVMITASHNPEPDNGVKLIDPMGEMLEHSWEQLATDLVNVSDNDLQAQIEKIIASEKIEIGSPSTVFVGMDNRYHSPILLKAVTDGVLALKGKFKSFGIVTTPMLHYLVVCSNTNGDYGKPTEEGYYSKLITSFKSLRGTEYERGNYKNKMYFDGANGVGARKMIQFLKRMDNCLNLTVYNSGEGKINENVSR